MLLDYHRSVAAGGVGMTTVAYAAVTQSGLSFDRQLWMRPSIISRLNELTKAVHDEGAAVGIQIGHCGNMSHKKICGVTPISASSITLNAFTVNLVNLTKSTTYTYRAYAKTATQTYYGSEMNFTTTAGVQKTYITVSELRAKGETTITEDLFMKAVMISDQTGANSTSLKNIVVSDNGFILVFIYCFNFYLNICGMNRDKLSVIKLSVSLMPIPADSPPINHEPITG
jgi:hypothetical protein